MIAAADIYTLLVSTGLPVAYRVWQTPPALPYLVYFFDASADLIADGTNFVPVSDWEIELYSDAKDPVSEAAIEEVLKRAGIPWEKREQYVESERLCQVSYSIRTI